MNILGLIVAVFALDQWSKWAIKTSFNLYQSKPVIQDFFHLTYVTNDGMAFGLNFPGGIYLFSAVSIILTGVIFFYLWKEQHNHILMRLGLALILAGAVGNLIDRILFGTVVDFFDFMIAGHHWYIFNIADSSVTVGMTIFLYFSFIVQPKLQTTSVS